MSVIPPEENTNPNNNPGPPERYFGGNEGAVEAQHLPATVYVEMQPQLNTMVVDETFIQMWTDEMTGKLSQKETQYKLIRAMRRDPTLALARALSVAPIIAGEWAVVGDDDEQVDYLKEHLLPWHDHYMETAAYGIMDFGWKAWEKVFGVADDGITKVLEKLKPLRVEHTWAFYTREGDFNGLQNNSIFSGDQFYIDPEHSCFFGTDTEGLGGYGESIMLNAKGAYLNWLAANEAAARYDRKLAGEHFLVYYPIGRTKCSFLPADGADGMVDNGKIAEHVLKTLCGSGSVSVPTYVDQLTGENGESGWRIEIVSSSGQQANFAHRLNYLDTLKVRALLSPERAMLEGTFGTKAEAETHGASAISIREQSHEKLTKYFNENIAQQLLEANFGYSGGAEITASPLSDERMEFFQELFTQLLSNPQTSAETLHGLDIQEIKRVLKIPDDPQLDEGIETMQIDPLTGQPVLSDGTVTGPAIIDPITGEPVEDESDVPQFDEATVAQMSDDELQQQLQHHTAELYDQTTQAEGFDNIPPLEENEVRGLSDDELMELLSQVKGEVKIL